MGDAPLTGRAILQELAEIDARERREYEAVVFEAVARLCAATGATVMPRYDVVNGGRPIILLSEAMLKKFVARYKREPPK